MSPNENRVFAEFAPETRFEFLPGAAPPIRAARETEFERLKADLLAAELYLARHRGLYEPIRRAANDAAALAWASVFPALLFPVLFEEKVAAEKLQLRRQKRIRARTAAPLTA